MTDDVPAHPPTQPAGQSEMAAVAGPPRGDGRCDQCGYALVGLPREGVCPECGSPYTNESARRLQPWPSAGMICLRLGWPLAAIVLVPVFAQLGPPAAIFAMLLGWPLALALPINSYFQVRSMLKKSLPEQKRTRGPILAMRTIGTTICVLLLLGLAAPFLLLVGCLIVMSTNGGHF